MVSLRSAAIVWTTAASLAVGQETTKRGYLGVVTTPAAEGELVTSVDPQGPAAAAGIMVGHTILRFDSQPITAQNTLRAQMQSKKAAQVVRLTIRDAAGKVEEKTATLRERPTNPTFPRSNYRLFDDDDMAAVPGFNDVIAQTQFMQPGPRPMLGVTVIDPDPRLREQMKLGDARGAMISEVRPNTPAFDAKLQVNDLVQAIDGKPVTATIDLQRIISTTKPDSQVKLKVLRDGKSIEVPVTVKTMTAPTMGGTPGGFPSMGMAMAPNADLVNQVNELKQRVATLEARIQALERQVGGQPGAPGNLKAPVQPPPARTKSIP
jgi:S1-C subfamily serine protease